MQLSLNRLIASSLLCCGLSAATPADLIVSAGKVVTMDAQRRVIDNGAVAIGGGRILAVASRAEIDSRYTAARRIDRPAAILTPGLINTHTHAAMSLLRGIADDMDLQHWLKDFIFPAEAKNVNESFVRAGTRLAMLEMMLGGTTTFVDMYYFEEAVAEEAKKAGMRGVLGETILGFPSPDYKTWQQAIAGTEKFMQKYQHDALVVPAVAPHAVYTNSDDSIKASRALADQYGMPMLIHVSETKTEGVEAAERYGKLTPTGYLDSIGALNGRTLFAHGVWTTAADRATMARLKVGVAHCPSSNMKLGSGAAPVSEYLKAGVAVGLGTDGPAGSNNDFDMFEEMDLASKLAKVNALDPSVLPARVTFEMGTILGAKALRMDAEIGSLEAGKRADLITISTEEPNAWPDHEVYSMLVYALKASNVQDVVIEGRVTVESRKPLTLNSAQIHREAAEIRKAVDASVRAAQKQ
jgi:5-methylthioadenosine/S-adenosylhomocysteine deaminase